MQFPECRLKDFKGPKKKIRKEISLIGNKWDDFPSHRTTSLLWGRLPFSEDAISY